METIRSALAPVALAVQPAPVVTTPTDSVVILVWIMKSIRDMDCEPFMGDHDVEVASRWIRKIEKTLILIKVLDELKVDSAS